MKFSLDSEALPSTESIQLASCLRDIVVSNLDSSSINNPRVQKLLVDLSAQLLMSNEGFLDKLKYTFTSDFKCAAKIDDMLKTLSSLDAEGTNKLDSTVIDYGMTDKSTTYELLKMANITMKWANDNLQEIRDMIMSWKAAFDSSKRDEARSAFLAMHDDLKKKLPQDIKIYKIWMKGRNSNGSKRPEGKTLKELGYSKSDIIKLIKDFKESCAGNLKTLKKLRDTVNILVEDRFGNTVTVHGYMYPVLDFCKTVVDAYKYIDYFLYYIGKKI